MGWYVWGEKANNFFKAVEDVKCNTGRIDTHPIDVYMCDFVMYTHKQMQGLILQACYANQGLFYH